MAVNNRFISNSEAAPVVETDIFQTHPGRRFALIAFGKGLREDDPLFKGYLKLRANVYVDQTGMLPRDVVHEDGTETDEDDERSTHFVVLENRLGAAAAVSCIRIIEKSEQDSRPLPIEEFFPERFDDTPAPNGSVEVSRFISCLDEKDQQLLAIFELFKSGLAHARKNKLGPAYAVVEEDLEQSLGYLGAIPKRIADPKYVEEYNDYNLGLEIEADKMAELIGAKRVDSLDVSEGAVRYWGWVEDQQEAMSKAMHELYRSSS
jgi:N-acyl-L-homoserine lactone synthetase